MTGVAEFVTIPVLALLGQLAAESVVGSMATERSLEGAQAEGHRIAALEEAKSDFLRLAAHELRGPVGLTRGYVSMLEDGTLGDLPPKARAVPPTSTPAPTSPPSSRRRIPIGSSISTTR